MAGLWHDLGKYSAEFQQRIKSVSGYEAHLEGPVGRIDRSTAGAKHTVAQFGAQGRILAYLIADIKRRLLTGEAVRVVSAQLVEAGDG